MKAILKISLLILSISLVNCKKTNDYYVVELENEPATVRKITDLPDNLELFDELFYLELVNPHAKLTYTALLVADMIEGYENSDELFVPYKIEGLAVKVNGIIFAKKKDTYGEKAQINGISFHNITLYSIEADE